MKTFRKNESGAALALSLVFILVAGIAFAVFGKRALKSIEVGKIAAESSSARTRGQEVMTRVETALSAWMTYQVSLFVGDPAEDLLPVGINYDSLDQRILPTDHPLLSASLNRTTKDFHRFQIEIRGVENWNRDPSPTAYPKTALIKIVVWQTPETFSEILAQTNIVRPKVKNFSTIVSSHNQKKYYLGPMNAKKVGIFFADPSNPGDLPSGANPKTIQFVPQAPDRVDISQLYTNLPVDNIVTGGQFQGTATTGEVNIPGGVVTPIAAESLLADLRAKVNGLKTAATTKRPETYGQSPATGKISICRNSSGTQTTLTYETIVDLPPDL